MRPESERKPCRVHLLLLGRGDVNSAALCLPRHCWSPQASQPFVLSLRSSHSLNLHGCATGREKTWPIWCSRSAAAGSCLLFFRVASCPNEFPMSEFLKIPSGLYSPLAFWLLSVVLKLSLILSQGDLFFLGAEERIIKKYLKMCWCYLKIPEMCWVCISLFCPLSLFFFGTTQPPGREH